MRHCRRQQGQDLEGGKNVSVQHRVRAYSRKSLLHRHSCGSACCTDIHRVSDYCTDIHRVSDYCADIHRVSAYCRLSCGSAYCTDIHRVTAYCTDRHSCGSAYCTDSHRVRAYCTDIHVGVIIVVVVCMSFHTDASSSDGVFCVHTSSGTYLQ